MNFEIPTRRKGQGAIEYILLLAGVLLIVVLAIIILKNSVLTQANTQIQNGTTGWQATSCGTPYVNASSGKVLSGWNGTSCCSRGINTTGFVCCSIGLNTDESYGSGGIASGTCINYATT